MYNAHFGFREKPFKLVPNPDYLYLSKNHEIALAHLTYAVSQGDGFVVITGEVGTGKTTLCRVFLERLDDDVESAYIFNPRLDSVQLLATICNEFGLRTNVSNIKQLLDVINGYLIMKNQAGRKVILLIDEAQNLSVENLEMVRMLSNLETTRNKLLQIILVGQPELGDMLDSYELRQLAQRISLSAHLTPMGIKETAGYIQHRINTAAQRQMAIFTGAAMRRIHHYANGIPRMINIACDRALLTAFSLNRPKVTGWIAQIAIRELSSRGRPSKSWVSRHMMVWCSAVLVIMIVSSVIYHFTREQIGFHSAQATTADPRVQDQAVDIVASAPNPQPRTFKIDPIPVDLATTSTDGAAAITSEVLREISTAAPSSTQEVVAATIDGLEHQSSRLDAVSRILERWRQPAPNALQLPSSVPDAEYFDIAAHQYGLRMHTFSADWALIKQLNLPAILSFKKRTAGSPVYMAMVGWHNGQVQLVNGADQKVIQTDLDTLLPYVQGPIFVFWKNGLAFDGVITPASPPKSIIAAKKMLRQVGYDHIDLQPFLDADTQRAITDFQMRQGLNADGLIGPLTKIFLIKEANTVLYPRLN